MPSWDAIRTGDETDVSIGLPSPARRRPPDPLDQLGARALVRLARRADRLRRRNHARFAALANDSGVGPRRLRLLADAWAEGGRSGLEAIGPALGCDPGMMDRATSVIETWRRRHFPLDALDVEVWRNRITVWWLRPTGDPTLRLHRHALMQLRRTDDGRWHLYRRTGQGEWWPVMVRGRRGPQSLSACLDTVRADLLHVFWGVQGPPADLAVGDAMNRWLLD